MADLLRDDESQPCVQPRAFDAVKSHQNAPGEYAVGAEAAAAMLRGEKVTLRFAGGPVDTTDMPASHNGPTPTTIPVTLGSVALVHYALKDLDGHLAEARRLVALGRHEEAEYELSQVVALGREAIGWLE